MEVNISALFASKNKKNSITWKSVSITETFGNRFIPVNFIEFINKEVACNTCQSHNTFKNDDVMCLDNSIGETYANLIDIYKGKYEVSQSFFDVMQYFAYNTTLVTLSSYSQKREYGVLIAPAYPRIFAEHCLNTITINNKIFRQWSHSNCIPAEEEYKFKEIVDKFKDEKEFRKILTFLFAKFPLSYNTISVKRIWNIILTDSVDSLKIRTSLAISWLAMYNVFYEPSIKFLGFGENYNDNNVFLEYSKQMEDFYLRREEN